MAVSHLLSEGINGLSLYPKCNSRAHPDQEILKEMQSDEYGEQILNRYSEFRDEGIFCDFILTVENEDFKVV
jgi:hypothetical protein